MGAFRQRGGMLQKPLPPWVKQLEVFDPNLARAQEASGLDATGMSITNTCWAAALSSWLTAQRAVDWSVNNLNKRFEAFVNENGLDMAHFNDVAEALFVRMDYETIGQGQLTWEYLYDKLSHSYVYTMLIGSKIGHAMVIHGVTLDSQGTRDIHFMDPMVGVREGALSEYQKRSSTFLIGWAKETTRFMLS